MPISRRKIVERYKLLVKLVHLRKSTQEIYLRSWISRATHYSSGSRRGLYKIEEGNYPSLTFNLSYALYNTVL